MEVKLPAHRRSKYRTHSVSGTHYSSEFWVQEGARICRPESPHRAQRGEQLLRTNIAPSLLHVLENNILLT